LQITKLKNLKTTALAFAISGIIVAASGQSANPPVAPMPADLPKDMKPVYAAPDRAAEDLKAHGIGAGEDELIAFLKNGLSRTTNLPQRPAEKSQLVIDAMAKLARLRSAAAVPVLMQIARFDTSLGAFKVIEFDVAKTSPPTRDDFRVRAYRLIQYNAITALGVIGDPQATGLIRSILQQESAAGAQIQYAICLASLGDTSGVNHLISLINLQNRRESAAAAKAFYFITGQNFGYTENTPVRLRKTLPSRYAQWWAQNSSSFRPDAQAIEERRQKPPTMSVYTARSSRDLLKLAANYFDFNNTLGSAAAREQISQAGKSWNKEFERIALDVNEDLDVRMEAMNWYFEANRSDPLEVLKKLRKDENPEIVDKANTLLEQIAEESAKK
jgi:hypothetical protein